MTEEYNLDKFIEIIIKMHERINNLIEHKNMQINENRKLSLRIDEMEEDFKKRLYQLEKKLK